MKINLTRPLDISPKLLSDSKKSQRENGSAIKDYLIEIKSVSSQLIFECTGDFASQQTIMGESTSNGISYVESLMSLLSRLEDINAGIIEQR